MKRPINTTTPAKTARTSIITHAPHGPAFIRPLGLRLTLSEAMLQLSMMLWIHRDPAGDTASSTFLHFTAVMGIHHRSHRPAHNLSPPLAGFV